MGLASRSQIWARPFRPHHSPLSAPFHENTTQMSARLGPASLAFWASQMHRPPLFRLFNVRLTVSGVPRSTLTTPSVENWKINQASKVRHKYRAHPSCQDHWSEDCWGDCLLVASQAMRSHSSALDQSWQQLHSFSVHEDLCCVAPTLVSAALWSAAKIVPCEDLGCLTLACSSARALATDRQQQTTTTFDDQRCSQQWTQTAVGLSHNCCCVGWYLTNWWQIYWLDVNCLSTTPWTQKCNIILRNIGNSPFISVTSYSRLCKLVQHPSGALLTGHYSQASKALHKPNGVTVLVSMLTLAESRHQKKLTHSQYA